MTIAFEFQYLTYNGFATPDQTGIHMCFSRQNICIIGIPTAKKKGRELNHKMGHCKCMKGATFSEVGHLVLP